MRNRFWLTVFTATVTILLLGCQQLLPMKRTISISITVPNPAWQVEIEQVYLGNGSLHVVSRLSRNPDAEMVAQVISRATDSVSISAPNLPLQHHVLGKTWNWQEEDFNFVSNEASLRRTLANLKLLYDRKK